MDIGQFFVDQKLATRQQVEEARRTATGGRVDRQLVSMGVMSEEQALRAFADDLGMQYVSVKDRTIDPELLRQFPTTAIFRHEILPLER
ncbi:MAG: type II/IV secretion system protein, partial [Planctomycetaceae bacterium]|nr:type II/IV secretion system protein [Planctomycetaceae bacterium]